MAAEGIEEVALPALVEESLLIVLAMDLDEPAGRVREPRGGDGLVVQPGRGAAARRDLADGDERLRQPIEQRLDAGGFRAMPDEACIRACPERKAQGVDEKALSGTGLAGQDVEARAELEPQPVDEGEIGDSEPHEPSGPCACLGRWLRGGHDGRSSTL